MLAISGNPSPISAGGVKLNAASGTATIKLMDEAVRIPAGKKLVVYFGSTSLAQELSERALSRSRAARTRRSRSDVRPCISPC